MTDAMTTARRKRVSRTPWGEGVRNLLDARGLTQLQLARLSGLDPATVGHVVRGGHCSTETLQKIAHALEVDMAELFAAASEQAGFLERRDRVVLAVLRELSEEVATAVAVATDRRRKRPLVPARPDRPLPFEGN
jgi:transcriptional regulator with XRE-family HTH domain